MVGALVLKKYHLLLQTKRGSYYQYLTKKLKENIFPTSKLIIPQQFFFFYLGLVLSEEKNARFPTCFYSLFALY